MKTRNPQRAVLLGIWLAVLATGCATQEPSKLPVCPGKATVEEALATLAARADNAVSFRVSGGQMLLRYHEPGDDREKRHNLPMQLWFEPPWNVYIQGSIATDPRAVVIGSNEERFWLALSPKEMSSYYTGRWEDVREVEGLMTSQKLMLEAFGIIVEQDEPDAGQWSLKNDGPFDVLTKRDDSGRPVKRVYVYACDYLVHRIEYMDRRGRVVAAADLSDYKPVTEEFRIPTRVQVTAAGPDRRRDSIDATLEFIKPMEFSQRLRDVIFNPPDANRFEHVYEYVDGRWQTER